MIWEVRKMKGIFFYLLIGAALYLSYVEKSKADFASFPIGTDSGLILITVF